MPDDSLALGRKIAKGAAWMVVMRWSVRAIGLASTLILVRLLAPRDFGLVAMAMILIGFLEVLGLFGFETIIIQKQTNDRLYYDTGWTLNILKSSTVAALLLILAYPTSLFYHEPRLVPVIAVLTLSSFMNGFENIGMVDFRKNLNFRPQFMLLSGKKMIAAAVTVSMAFVFRSYWALVIGMVTATTAGVVLSYVMSPYRPRLNLSKAREMFHFSKWLVMNEILIYLANQADSGLIGRLINSQVLGFYEISKEVALLPSTELTGPVTAALFPGYAKIKDDLPRLRKTFMDSMSLMLIVLLPMTIGISLVAKNMVPVVLGEKWVPAIPFMQLLAIYGCIASGWLTTSSIYLALGRPSLNTFLFICGVVPRLAFVTIGVIEGGALGAAYGLIASATLNYSVGYFTTHYYLGLSFKQVIKIKWRVVASLAAMALAVHGVDVIAGGMSNLSLLILKVSTGAICYGLCLIGLWFASGRPEGGEQIIMRETMRRLNKVTV